MKKEKYLIPTIEIVDINFEEIITCSQQGSPIHEPGEHDQEEDWDW